MRAQADGQPQSDEGRISRGLRLTGAAWSVMRRDPTMISLALLGAGFAIAGVAIVLYVGGYFSGTHYSRSHFALVWLIALYPMTFISVFFNVALASAAGAHFDGRRLALGEALRAAYDRIGRIALWALLSAGVGLLISEIANRLPGGGRIVGWLMGAAWGLATIFAVPLLALEDARPLEALRGSAHLVKSRWGEGLTGVVGIGAWAAIALIPVGVLIAIGAAVANSSPAAGIPIIAVGLLAVVVIAALTTATRQVFAVALYCYATDMPVGGFAQADLGVLLGALAIAPPALATTLPTTISASMTLTAAGSPYTGTSTTISEGVTVTAEPGATVKLTAL